MTTNNDNCPSATYTNLLDLPDKYIDFNSSLLISCGLANNDALLHHCQYYVNDLYVNRLSVHGFAEKWADNGISLWTADDVPDLEEQAQEFAFYMVFKQQTDPQNNGYILIQCRFDRQERLQ